MLLRVVHIRVKNVMHIWVALHERSYPSRTAWHTLWHHMYPFLGGARPLLLNLFTFFNIIGQTTQCGVNLLLGRFSGMESRGDAYYGRAFLKAIATELRPLLAELNIFATATPATIRAPTPTPTPTPAPAPAPAAATTSATA